MSDVIVFGWLEIGFEVDFAVILEFHGSVGIVAFPEIHDYLLQLAWDFSFSDYKYFR